MSVIRRDPPFGTATTGDRHFIFTLPTTPISGDDLRAGEGAYSLDSASGNLVLRAKDDTGALLCALICVNPA